MSRSVSRSRWRGRAGVLVSLGSSVLSVASVHAAVSATVVSGSFTQGTVQGTLGTGTSYANAGNSLSDWWTSTSSLANQSGTKFAVSLTNANYNNAVNGNATMLAFGTGGGVTLQFDEPINAVTGQKEFGLFTAQGYNAGNGGVINGNMEAAILVSADNQNWFTLTGSPVAAPLTYTATSHKLNAPSSGYDFTTFNKAWTYGTPGTTYANLAALSIADYTTPMPDDSLFNGAGTNADRFAMRTNTDEATYDAAFGTSGGGNWIDFSSSGLSQIQYVRLNGVNTGGGIRLDAVFANAAAVPEPTGLALLGVGGALALIRTRRRRGARSAAAVIAGLAASVAFSNGASAQVSLDDLTYTGAGSNRAAVVIDWQAPEVRNNTTVPNPIENRVLAFGYQFDGAITGTQLINGVLANDGRLFATVGFNGGFVFGLGYDLDDDGTFGVTNGTITFDQTDFTAGKLEDDDYDPDSFYSLDPDDLFWAGLSGPNFDLWNETGGAGGFTTQPDRGSNTYWTPDDPDAPFSGAHGQWDYAGLGTDAQTILNGSWQGWSVAAGGLEFLDPDAPGTVAYNLNKQAPGLVPEPASLALIATAGLLGMRRRR